MAAWVAAVRVAVPAVLVEAVAGGSLWRGGAVLVKRSERVAWRRRGGAQAADELVGNELEDRSRDRVPAQRTTSV